MWIGLGSNLGMPVDRLSTNTLSHDTTNFGKENWKENLRLFLTHLFKTNFYAFICNSPLCQFNATKLQLPIKNTGSIWQSEGSVEDRMTIAAYLLLFMKLRYKAET
jgi:hypothetical protein